MSDLEWIELAIRRVRADIEDQMPHDRTVLEALRRLADELCKIGKERGTKP